MDRRSSVLMHCVDLTPQQEMNSKGFYHSLLHFRAYKEEQKILKFWQSILQDNRPSSCHTFKLLFFDSLFKILMANRSGNSVVLNIFFSLVAGIFYNFISVSIRWLMWAFSASISLQTFSLSISYTISLPLFQVMCKYYLWFFHLNLLSRLFSVNQTCILANLKYKTQRTSL